ncbi:MAG: protein-disulfide reductase DsbD [Candidatus Marinimicrobia bacterium]|nr:protein-disulfide reductase DsbD [Candidatus Neomarinimicrobiota bacterium]MDD4961768.1 protein-disulfide reductase DsbD [Candidatus Neomarinimicrobiota bacterium]MDD5708952.1 protein-disulfide reductase DsbD [Candidatus Neomarinimicrobiota bacterium]
MKKILAILLLLSGFRALSAEAVVSVTLDPERSGMPASAGREMVLEVRIAEGWHINSAKPLDKYSIPSSLRLDMPENSGLSIGNIRYPEGKIVSTGWGGDLSLYEGSLKITFTLNTAPDILSGDHDFRILFTYQACNDLTCLSPETVFADGKLRITEAISENAWNGRENEGSEISIPAENVSPVATDGEDAAAEGPFANKSMFLILLIVFVMGLALNLTPCVYPLIPITMSYFIAQKERCSPVLLAFMYVLGLALTYSLIGTLAAFGGKMMGSLLAHPATLIFFALLMLALSLSMFGLYEFRLPSGLTRAGGGSRSGAFGALIMGLTMGIVAAPCVGPFVVSLLSFVAQTGNLITGFFTFFVLALGLGVPYLLLGIFSGKIARLPRSGEWLNGVRIFFGLALIGMAIYFVLPLLPEKIATLILPVYMIAAAVYYALIDRSGQALPGFLRIKTLIAMLVLALGVLMIKPAATAGETLSWEKYSPRQLEQALEEGRPVIIDFYADWCNPCKELEHITFADPEVKALLAEFVRLKVDLTVANAESEAVRGSFDIAGVPTLVFYTKKGEERKELRLTGFEKPADFVLRIKGVLQP